MGRGLGQPLIAYLDTNAVVWLTQKKLKGIGREALRLLKRSDLLVSPMVLLELEYLFDLRRTLFRSRDLQRKLQTELSVTLCELPFSRIIEVALDEGWTTDPFDRIIVAQAKANGFAPLITADTHIAAHYPKAVW